MLINAVSDVLKWKILLPKLSLKLKKNILA